MKIDNIKKTKSGKYKIKLDGEEFTTYDDVLIKNGILYKKEIDNDLFEQMNKDHQYYDAYNKTISYIMKHQRCTDEIKKYLDKFPLNNDDKIKIINHLSDIGLVNDRVYVKSYISDSINLGTDGPYKIRQHLLDLNIDSEIIEDELSNIDHALVYNKLKKLIDKKINCNNKYSEYQLKQKISLDMVNKGYDRDTINSILDNYSFNDDELLLNEYNKLSAKLSKKYSGYELTSKIKQKLYSKGYDINKINEIIKKEII